MLVAVGPGCRHDGPALGKGVRYRHITVSEAPLSIHLVEIRLDQPQLYITTSVGAAIKGKETVPQMVAALPPQRGVPLVAVNGDYFEFKTEPRFYGTLEGLCIEDGELLSAPAGSALCIDSRGQPRIRKVRALFELTWPDGSSAPFGLNCSTADYKSEVKARPVVLFTPRFGVATGTTGIREVVLARAGPGPWLPLRAGQRYRAKVQEFHQSGNTTIPPDAMVLSISTKADATLPPLQPGDTLEISTAFDEDMSEVVTAVGGGPPLLSGGTILPKQPADPAPRAPRTAVGLSATHLFLAVVDGRQDKLSIGMTHRELAEFMLTLGCTDALNLDGGGSSTFWLAGRVVNSPSDGLLRAVGNCVVLTRRATPGR